MGTFWTDASIQPKRNYRFRVTISGLSAEGGVVWWAKSFKAPSYELSEATHDHLDNKFYFPGRVSWNECSMTLVDPVSPNAVQLTNQLLIDSGYVVKGPNATAKTVNRKDANDALGGLGGVVVEVLNGQGDPVETWTLQNPFIKSVNFSDLAYDNDELRTIDVGFRYDWATCENIGSGEQFTKVTT